MPRLVRRAFFGFMLLGILGLQIVSGIQTQAPADTKQADTKQMDTKQVDTKVDTDETDAKQSRKLKSGQPPEYPELARQMNIKGVARVMVTVSADGAVKEVKEVGGHPLLIEALTRAVKKWKYEP